MITQTIALNAWRENKVFVAAVQGEKESRALLINLIDKQGGADTLSASDICRTPVSLINASARLLIEKPDGSLCSCEGTVTNAADGQVIFLLPERALDIPGKARCTVIIAESALQQNLRFAGLTLAIDECNAGSI